MDQTRNIKSYAAYLEEKVVAFREMNEDYLRPDAEELILRMQTMLWKDGLHKEVSVLQNLLSALLQSKFFVDSVDNEVTLTALQVNI